MTIPVRPATLKRCATTLLLALGSFLAPTSLLQADDEPASSAPPASDEDWQVIFMQGQRVGYAHSRMWETATDGDQRLWTESVTRMSIKRFGGSLNMTVTQITEEDEAGNLLSFVYENDNPPVSNTKLTGRIDGQTLRVETTAAGKTTERSLTWDTDVKSPVYQDRLLEQNPVTPGQTRSFKSFEPEFLKVGTVTIRGQEPADTTLRDGTTARLERATITHSLLPGVTTTVYSDAEGDVLKTEADLLQMVIYSVSREEALKELAGGQLDLAVDTLVKVKPIENAHQTRRIVYLMTLDLDRPQPGLDLHSGPTQQIDLVAAKGDYSITVTSIDPRDRPEAVPAIAADPKYLSSSRLQECEHPDVVKLANEAAGERTDPVETAIALEQFVHQRLESKNFSTALATAAEVAQSLEGDCTEHAVLLAALLRVKKIPSRIAVGLVYADSHSAFGGHMWTEAFLDGRWVPLDATLGRGGIGAAHIKFADSSLDDDAPAPETTFLPLIGLLDHMSLEVIVAE